MKMKCLIVKQPYAGLIVSGEKTLEMRSRHTKIRGEIGIIAKGSGNIIGTVNLIDSIYFNADYKLKSEAGFICHKIPGSEWGLLDKYRYGWQFSDAKKFKTPKPYDHPMGAVIWVNCE